MTDEKTICNICGRRAGDGDEECRAASDIMYEDGLLDEVECLEVTLVNAIARAERAEKALAAAERRVAVLEGRIPLMPKLMLLLPKEEAAPADGGEGGDR